MAYLNSTPHIGNIQIATVNPFNEVENDGIISTRLPNSEADVNFSILDIQMNSEEDFSWYGTRESGSIAIYRKPEGWGGHIQVDEKDYAFYPLDRNRVAVVEYNISQVVRHECGGHTGEDKPALVTYCDKGSCGIAVMDVLVLLTPSANQWLNANFGNFGHLFLLVETLTTNQILRNSGVNNKTIRVTFSNLNNNFGGGNNVEALLGAVQTNLPVQTLSQNNNADMTFVFFGIDLMLSISNTTQVQVGGLASTFDPTAPDKYAIVDVRTIDQTRYTFAHEMGHLWSCRHENDNSGEPCAHGHILPTGRRTVMAIAANNTRIPNYSNPDITFGANPTGVAGVSECAEVIDASFCAAANTRPDPYFIVDISGADKMCPPGSGAYNNVYSANIITGTYYGMPTLGTAPYTYKWETSNYGTGSFYTYSTTAATVTITNIVCKSFYLRLTVTGADGYSKSVTKSISTRFCPECDKLAPNGGFNGRIQRKKDDDFVINPNPSRDEFYLDILDNKDLESISIIDASSRIIGIFDYKKDMLYDSYSMGLSNLLSGIYFIQFKYANRVSTKKLIINTF